MDIDGLTGVSYAYQWIRRTPNNMDRTIAGAMANTYTLVEADEGNKDQGDCEFHGRRR